MGRSAAGCFALAGAVGLACFPPALGAARARQAANAAFEAAGIPMPENVGIRVEDNPDDDGSTVTLSADGMEDLEIRYDADGGLVVEEATPPPGLERDGE